MNYTVATGCSARFFWPRSRPLNVVTVFGATGAGGGIGMHLHMQSCHWSNSKLVPWKMHFYYHPCTTTSALLLPPWDLFSWIFCLSYIYVLFCYPTLASSSLANVCMACLMSSTYDLSFFDYSRFFHWCLGSKEGNKKAGASMKNALVQVPPDNL